MRQERYSLMPLLKRIEIVVLAFVLVLTRDRWCVLRDDNSKSTAHDRPISLLPVASANCSDVTLIAQ